MIQIYKCEVSIKWCWNCFVVFLVHEGGNLPALISKIIVPLPQQGTAMPKIRINGR